MTRRLLLAPFPSLLVGVIVMSQGGVPFRTWGQNVAATVLGAGLVLATQKRRDVSTRTATALGGALVGVALLAATLLQGGVDGVRRWIAAGPMQLHAAAILLPAMLVVLPQLGRSASRGIALMTLCILWLQPDAAQAAAFAVAWSVGGLASRDRDALVPIGVAWVIAIATAFRADPLPPVAHVEGIVGMASRAGSAWGVLALLTLVLPPIAWLRSSDRQLGTTLAAYITVALLAAWVANFPVPYLGYGVSPILGYYFAVAVTPGQRHEEGTGIPRLV